MRLLVATSILLLWAVVPTQPFATHQITTKRHFSPSSSSSPMFQTTLPFQGKASITGLSKKSSQLPALAIDSAQEGSWKAFLDDEETGLVFYYNMETGESVWEPPTTSFPKVRLNHWMEEKISDVRDTYLKNLQKNRWGLFGNMMKFLNHEEDKVSLDTMENKPTVPTSISMQARQWKSSREEQKVAKPIEDDNSKDVRIKPFIHSMVESISSSDIFHNKHFKEIASVLAPKEALATQNEVNEVSFTADDSKKEKDSLSPKQQIETAKAGLIGLIAGGSAVVPFNIIRGLLGDSIYNPGEVYFTSAAGGVESSLLVILYRFCVRDGEENNDQLANAVTGAFVVTRALSMTTGWDDGILNMMPQMAWNGLESFVMFDVAKKVVESTMNKGFIERMK